MLYDQFDQRKLIESHNNVLLSPQTSLKILHNFFLHHDFKNANTILHNVPAKSYFFRLHLAKNRVIGCICLNQNKFY